VSGAPDSVEVRVRERYPRLLSPLRIGPVELAHRAVMSAHGMGLGAGGPGVSDRYRAYLVERARGGAAMVGVESAPVHRTTFSRSLVIRLDEDASIASLARLADDVHAAGARIAITLWHGGHKDGALRGAWSVAPSAVPGMMGDVPRVLTRAGIAEIVDAYGAAAARCRRAGFDVLEVQTATDYLLGSFLSPALNHRDDEYGGPLENRARIVREVLAAVRAAAGAGVAVGVRCSARHDIPGATVDYTLEESVAAMAHLDAAGLVDYVSVMAGSAWAEGVSIPALHHPRACLAEDAATFRRALRVPVIVAGRIRAAAEAERIIASGQADAVAMARTWIAEPEWGLKLRTGREAEIRPCVSCNQGCVGHVFRGVPGTCVLNPRAGREQDWPSPAPRPAALPLRVAVVGGGPAGLETARLAVLMGHRVTLHEASGELGGQWRLAALAPGRSELGLSLQWWAAELGRLGVDVRLHDRVDPNRPCTADRIVWAVGARPAQTAVWRLRPFLRDGIAGAGSLRHGRELLAGAIEAPSGRVAVIDEEGGWSAIALAAMLCAARTVERVDWFTPDPAFATATAAISFETAALSWLAAAQREQRLVIHKRQISQVIENKNIISSDGQAHGPFASVLLSTGTAANPWPDEPGALAAGDCIAPRGLWSATSDAWRLLAALQVGS
jgi:2,4-dienoyl-CoA reductase-like NADH-dependent reductase (Old Yellow Enzyme family)